MDKLRFLHIPKTAGSSLTGVLRRQYRGGGHFSFTGDLVSDRARFLALPAIQREKTVLFTGHAPVVSGLPEADAPPLITLLRDPVRRVQSFCRHVSEGKSLHLREAYPPEVFQLDQFLGCGHRELSNLQTRMLVNHGESDARFENMSKSAARDEALQTLFERMAGFGLQEYFNESLLRMAAALDWGLPVYRRVNEGSSRRLLPFTDRHLDRIREMNAVDLDVYAAARERFLRGGHSRNLPFSVCQGALSLANRAWSGLKEWMNP